MPKVGRIPDEEKALAAEIREMFDGALVLSASEVGRVIGLQNWYGITEWLSTLVPRWRNGRKVWLVSDVAHKLYSSKEERAG